MTLHDDKTHFSDKFSMARKGNKWCSDAGGEDIL